MYLAFLRTPSDGISQKSVANLRTKSMIPFDFIGWQAAGPWGPDGEHEGLEVSGREGQVLFAGPRSGKEAIPNLGSRSLTSLPVMAKFLIHF